MKNFIKRSYYYVLPQVKQHLIEYGFYQEKCNVQAEFFTYCLYAGDMESDQENDVKDFKEVVRRPEINISHEDLSDVSDLEESLGGNLDNDDIVNEEGSKRDEITSENKSVSPDAKQVIIFIFLNSV